MRTQVFPPGWNEERVRKVIAHYENQTEDEEVAEYEAGFAAAGQTTVVVPTELVSAIVQLIDRHQKRRPKPRRGRRRTAKA